MFFFLRLNLFVLLCCFSFFLLSRYMREVQPLDPKVYKNEWLKEAEQKNERIKGRRGNEVRKTVDKKMGKRSKKNENVNYFFCSSFFSLFSLCFLSLFSSPFSLVLFVLISTSVSDSFLPSLFLFSYLLSYFNFSKEKNILPDYFFHFHLNRNFSEKNKFSKIFETKLSNISFSWLK